MASLALVWDLIARDNASPAFHRVGTAAESAAKKTEAASATIGGGLSTAAKAAGAAGVVFAAASVKMAADFQSSTTRLVTSANESTKNLKMVQDGMLKLAGDAGYGTDELAKAMYKVESGGQHGADALLTLKAAAQGAKTENADLTTVADALTSAMTDYHLKADQAATVTSKLVAATASGKMTFEELSGSLAAILPVASANHVALNDILGDLASMTMHGMSAEQASQNLADAIRHLAAPTQQQHKQFAALGLTTQQISADLGTKGLSGTINVITDAIKSKMGASTTRVVLDLNTALSKLPPAVRKLGEGVLDGSISLGEYRKSIKGLSVEQAISAQSFLGLVSSTHQIGNETKDGAKIYQSYSGALRQALGDATGMNVALMIGGENAGNTATAIANVSKATAEAGGNVKGWSEIQGTFNQQASQTLHSLEAMTIEMGMHLLPALTAGMGYINRDAIPAIKGLGSGVADAAHWFNQLPGPVKAVAEAMAGMALANAVGLFSKLGAGISATTALVARYATATSASMGAVTLAYREAATAAAFLAEVQGRTAAVGLTSSIAGLGAAAGATAKVGFGAMRAAGSGLISMLGGPWVVGIGAAVGGVILLRNAMKSHDEEVRKATADMAGWYKTLALGGSSGDMASAKQHIDDLKTKIAALRVQVDAVDGSMLRGRGGAALKDRLAELTGELTNGQKKWNDYWNSLSPQSQAIEQVKADESALAGAIRDHGAASRVAKAASATYNADLEIQKTLTGQLTAAEQTQIDKLNQLANVELASVSSSLAAAQAQASFKDAVDQYNADAKDGAHSTRQLADESNNLAQQAISAAQAAGQHAVDQAKANGVTDDGTLANKAILDSLKKSAAQITGPGHDALVLAIKDLSKTTIGSGTLADTVKKMGLTVSQVWDKNTTVLASATAQQIKDLKGLGYTVRTLPNGKVVVTTDTGPAYKTINDLIKWAKTQSVVMTMTAAGAHISGPHGGGTILKADGGHVSGPGSGTSDSIPAWLSNGEFVVKASQTAKHRSLLESINAGRYATGGIVIPAKISQSSYAGAQAAIDKTLLAFAKAGMAASGSFGSGGSGGYRNLGRQIAAAMGYASQFGAIDYVFTRESGWNPRAQNPTSTAYGIPQFLNSTWAQYGGKTSDPGTQIRDGISYMRDRYGSPNGAASFWANHHWYDGGGLLMPGTTIAHNGTGKPETIRTAKQEAALRQPMEVRVFIGDRELTDIVRVEAEGVVVSALTTTTNRGRYNG